MAALQAPGEANIPGLKGKSPSGNPMQDLILSTGTHPPAISE
jgi:hypothetical protein